MTGERQLSSQRHIPSKHALITHSWCDYTLSSGPSALSSIPGPIHHFPFPQYFLAQCIARSIGNRQTFAELIYCSECILDARIKSLVSLGFYHFATKQPLAHSLEICERSLSTQVPQPVVNSVQLSSER